MREIQNNKDHGVCAKDVTSKVTNGWWKKKLKPYFSKIIFIFKE